MNEPTARNQLERRQIWLSGLLCAGVGLMVFQFWGNATRGYIHSRSLFYWWGVQWFDPAAELQHGLLILLVSGWLFWRNLRLQKSRAVAGGTGVVADAVVPVVAMQAGLVLHLFGFALQQSRISIVALLVFTWGVLAFAGGRRWGRAAVFPVGFLLLAMPLNFLDTLGFHLRLTVSESVYAIARAWGIALVRNGTQLVSADGRFQYDVAAACSGVRSLVALVALAVLIGYVGFRSWWARTLLAVASLPFVVVGNIARVFFLVLLGEKYGASMGSRWHEDSGIIAFLVVLGLLLATSALLRRVGFGKAVDANVEPEAAATEPVSSGREGRGGRWRVLAGVAGVSVLVAGAATWLESQQQQAAAGIVLTADGVAPARLPDLIGTNWIGRDAEVSPVEREVLPADTGYSRKNYVSTINLRRQVFFSVVLSGRDRTSIHRPEICLVGQGWSVVGRTKRNFDVGGEDLPCTLLHIEHAATGKGGEPVRVRSLLAYWFVGAEGVVPSHLGMQLSDLQFRLRHLRAERWAYIVVQSVVAEDGENAALARMQEVIAGIWPGVRAGDSGKSDTPPAPDKKG